MIENNSKVDKVCPYCGHIIAAQEYFPVAGTTMTDEDKKKH